jgi:hypothetical protein
VKIVARREPLIGEVNGRRGRTWTGKNEDGNICQVTIFETGNEKIEIEIHEIVDEEEATS